ncbi:hypothetical protein [Delftia tsuruhatensis]|jgi:hypothetical protein|uniref:Uncharacterized protein n=1 Tax=Delftia tsuruhatensis TaxID=180282 RepID=A0AAX3SGT5_9BURK|nr:hypothetical protein [Delftia tsuruhatensis]WFF79200.1 hypothetical protein PYR84_19925 [Delftia tsuruhatensis]
MKNRPPHIIEQQVLRALESPRFKYRTVSGIAKETKLDEESVREVLQSNPAVRRSFAREKNGKQLFAAKAKVSIGEDLWVAFKAVNAAKFGG